MGSLLLRLGQTLLGEFRINMTLTETITHVPVQPARTCIFKQQVTKKNHNANCECIDQKQTEKETVIQPVRAWSNCKLKKKL